MTYSSSLRGVVARTSPPSLTVAAIALLAACGASESEPRAEVVHACMEEIAAGTPCDFTGPCGAYWDGIDHLWGYAEWNCVDGAVVVNDARYYWNPEEACATAMQGPPSATFRVTEVALSANVGSNLDGLNNATPPGGAGANVLGCGIADSTGGIDNALAKVASSLAGTIDVGEGLSALFLGQGPSPATIDVELFDLETTDDDSLVCGRLVVHRAGLSDTFVSGRGALVGNVAQMYFDQVMTLTVTPDVVPSACVNQSCVASPLTIHLANLRATWTLDPQHTTLLANSFLAGVLFHQDCADGSLDAVTGVCAGGTYASSNSTGFREAWTSFALATGLEPTLRSSVLAALDAARDLHVEPDGTVHTCQGANVSSTDRNALSFAIGLRSGL